MAVVKIRDEGTDRHHKRLWLVRCHCGTEKVVRAANVKNGNTVSCGCGKGEGGRLASTTHGMTGTGTYSSWSAMIQRCKKDTNYIARVSICPRWTGKGGFANFLADMGERPEGLTLERKDNSLGYSRSNCKWATKAEQSCNTRRNVMLTYKGKTQCAALWARELGIAPKTLRARLYRGWPLERVLAPLTERSITCRFY